MNLAIRNSLMCAKVLWSYPRNINKQCFETARKLCTSNLKYNEHRITFNIINRNGEKEEVTGEIQDTILDVVIDNELEIESFGVCEGALACSTCHVILSENLYKILEEKCEPTYEEYDMLDLACGLTSTSRLGCQIELCKEMENETITLPSNITDARHS